MPSNYSAQERAAKEYMRKVYVHLASLKEKYPKALVIQCGDEVTVSGPDSEKFMQEMSEWFKL